MIDLTSTVWVVTTGSYSDYSMESLWSTKEKAYDYYNLRNKYGGDFNEPFEMPLDELDLFKVRVFTTVFMNEDGSIVQEMDMGGMRDKIYQRTFGFDEKPYRIGFGGFYEIYEDGYRKPTGRFYMSWDTETESIEQAIKVTAEKCTLIRTSGLWGKEEEVKSIFGVKKND